MKNQMKGKKGITLIALVITIIVLLILAGVTIATLTGDNGLLQKAGNAKETSEIGEEKDIVGLSVMQARANNLNGTIEKSKLDEALSENSKENNKATVLVANTDSYIIQFATSQRYYEVKDGKVENFKVDEWATVKYVNKKVNGEVVQEFTSLETKCPIISNSYSIVPPKIEGYEPELDVVTDSSRIVSDANGKKTITIEYYKILTNEDLAFTPYTENGIEKYSLGDASNRGKGVKDEVKSIKSVLYVPENYEGKKVGKICSHAFQGNSNIVKLIVKENIDVVDQYAFQCSKLKTISLNCDKVLGECAFAMIPEIEEVKLEKNCNSITRTTFNESKIKQLVINSNNVELSNDIGGTINTIEVDNDNTKYEVIDNVLYSKDKENRKIYMYPTGRQGDYVIPSDVKVIGPKAFFASKLKRIEIPDNVDTIKHGAFQASGLENVKINCKRIEDECAFGDCYKLKTVDIGKNVEHIGGTTFNSDSNIEINYEGTRAQWNALVGNRTFSAVTKITCSDD